jgi:ATP-dependent DNA helicase RecG
LEEAMTFLKRHVAIAAEFRLGQLSRETRPQYPFNSLREGLVNALVHRDYAAFSGGVSVSIYPGRVEIWNSGRLPLGLTPDKLLASTHDSILVNPDISHVFYLQELMERVGRGTFKIVQECKELGMQQPEWRNAVSGVRLTLHAATGQLSMPIELNGRQMAVLNQVNTGQSIRLNEFLERFGGGISERQARRHLHDLVNAGFLEITGAGRTTSYKRTDKEL